MTRGISTKSEKNQFIADINAENQFDIEMTSHTVIDSCITMLKEEIISETDKSEEGMNCLQVHVTSDSN